MIKLLSSAALALSVAVAFSAAPAQANDRAQFGLGQFEVHQVKGFGSKKFLKKKIRIKSRQQRFSRHHRSNRQFFNRNFRTGYTAQPRDFAANPWHRRATGHIDQFRVNPRFGR